MKASEILRLARGELAVPGRFCIASLAMKSLPSENAPLAVTEVDPKDPGACQFCSLGAIIKHDPNAPTTNPGICAPWEYLNDETKCRAVFYLARQVPMAFWELTDLNTGKIWGWNDSFVGSERDGTVPHELIEAFDRAIVDAEREGE